MNLCLIKLFSVVTTALALLMGIYGIGFVVMTVIKHYS